MIKNPILKGFNPDPSVIKVNDIFYIATSTFEWFPGVRIYQSRDLANWTLAATPLNRTSQLNMAGNPDSCGVWAPCLSYSDGGFYLIYTNSRRHRDHFKDTHNYLVTTTDIGGDWSDPVYLNSSGFDPSLFHDSNGRKWLVNMIWNFQQRGEPVADKYFAGIALQEYSQEKQSLVGQPKTIFKGSALGKAEGPHLYQRKGYYYLLVAEGGTGTDHACVMTRSENITGPYTVAPDGPFLTSAHHPDHPLQRAGHGDIIESAPGQFHVVHLCSRPLDNRRSVMGRETAIQPLDWSGDWPTLCHGKSNPELQFTHAASETNITPEKTRYLFQPGHLHPDFQTLRIPLGPNTLSLVDNPGKLRLYGKESIGSLFHQALVARRQQAFCFQANSAVDFTPTHFQQMAGLVCYYNSSKYHYLHIGFDEAKGRFIDILSCEGSAPSRWPLPESIAIPDDQTVWLRADVNRQQLHFSYSLDGDNYLQLPATLDYSLLSDEVGDGGEHANFTGSFVGLCCQDMSGQSNPADFHFFEYNEQE
ncbi:MAG: xylan 1,4-beta-xylosidase [Patiriisocius sp.]|jgi:xylan 1,4-beta-xylosidase